LKKHITISAALLSLGLFLTACGQTEENNQSPAVEEEAVTENVENSAEEAVEETAEETAEEEPSNSETPDEVAEDYELAAEVYSEGDITITYPQMMNLADSAKQTEINKLLFNEAYKVMNFYPETEGLELEIDYIVSFINPNFFSVQYSGTGFVEGTAHPSHMFYTTNIDVTNAKRIKLTDVVIPNKAFVEFFKSDAFRVVDPDLPELERDVKEYLIASDFENADSLDGIGTETHSETFTYFTENTLGINIAVSHALGGHAAFEINYNEIPSELLTENHVLELLQINE
jgi:hypothetical protein